MKKVSLLIIFFILTFLPCNAKSATSTDIKNENNSKIFIYHIPDEENSTQEKDANSEKISDDVEIIEDGITSDDITADTNLDTQISEDNNDYSEDEYEIEDMYSDVLHAYVSYDDEDTISLDDNIDSLLSIKIDKPFSVKGGKYYASKTSANYAYSKYNNMEYSITPISSKNYRSLGGFSAGTTYNQGIDYAELEQSTGIFSRYDSKYFAISTSYAKTVNTTNNNYNDNFYFSPELKLNQYFTLKEILSADITRNRKKVEFVLSINPFGNKDTNKLRIEFGANATYDDTNALLKNQVKFSTKFSL
jgi:hypothetical protein